jgi:hypothetical protein
MSEAGILVCRRISQKSSSTEVGQTFLSAVELLRGEVLLMVGQTFLSAMELASGEVLFSRANSSLLGGLKPALPASIADKNVCSTKESQHSQP